MDSSPVLYGPGRDLEDLPGGGSTNSEGVPSDRQVFRRPLLDAKRGWPDPLLSGGGTLLWSHRLEAPGCRLQSPYLKPMLNLLKNRLVSKAIPSIRWN